MKNEMDNLKKQKIFLKALKKSSEEQHIEFLYYYAKNMLEYYNTAFVENENIVNIDIRIQMNDIGDELFDAVYDVEKTLYGTAESINEHMKMSTTEPHDMNDDNGMTFDKKKNRYVMKQIGRNQQKLDFNWVIYLDQIKG